MSRILLVEDEVVIRTELRRLLIRHGHDVIEAGSVEDASADHDLRTFDLVLADVRLPGAPGTALVGQCGGAPVVLMTSYATVKVAVDAVKRGAADYPSKPFDHTELIALVDHHLPGAQPARARRPTSRRAARCPRRRRAARASAHIGRRRARGHGRRLCGRARGVRAGAQGRAERGDAARPRRERHGQGDARPRRAQAEPAPADGVRSGPLRGHPRGQIEGELFGYERGAVPGAISARAGLCEAAEGGTLMLDEIGELPPKVQARLLRFLQTGEVRRVGATRARRVDVRLIAATRRDLVAMVRDGSFMSDLYFRLRVLEIRLPPLRERPGDAVRLAESLLRRRAWAMGRAARR